MIDSVRSLRFRALIAAIVMAVVVSAGTATANAEFSIMSFGTSFTGGDGTFTRQAGAHGDFRTRFAFSLREGSSDGIPTPDEHPKDIEANLPVGLVGNPMAAARCDQSDLVGQRGAATCPLTSQVGTAAVTTNGFGLMEVPLYNMEAPGHLPALFAFNYLGTIVRIEPRLRPDDYGISTVTPDTSQGLGILEADITFWGVPSDPSHDARRVDPVKYQADPSSATPSSSPDSRRPFFSAPTSCLETPLTFSIRANTWQHPDVYASASSNTDLDGTPYVMTGCDRLPFEPSISVQPFSYVADAATGLKVVLTIPQSDAPDGLATAHLKDATVTLPEGMSINPSSAAGLDSCSDAQIGFGTDSAVTCPETSKIGSVTADTPLLEKPLEGSVYVGQQRSNDPESGEMFRLLMVLEGPGLLVKLHGHVRADARNGEVQASFASNPQLPVEKISVRLDGGPTAPLANPPTCGTKYATARLTSWSGKDVAIADPIDITCRGDAGFAPSFGAGSLNPTGGSFSPFAVRIARRDGDRYLSGVSVGMPKGLLAKLKGVELCPGPVAGDGTPGVCPAGSRVGTATVGAGAGDPFLLSGPVYLTGPYQGGPYGLSVQVPAKAGPFDLGMVKVRQAIQIDPDTAEITVVSDPLPQVVKGVPVRLRSVHVDIDRPGFTINPTSCDAKQIDATLTSIDGTVSRSSQRFEVGDCSALAFKPKLAMRLTGKRHMRTGGHPSLRAMLTQGSGQANVDRAEVTLPRNLVLDSKNAYDPKLVCDYDKSLQADCPASSVIGKASLATPLLDRRLSGAVHLVQGIRFSKAGNRIRTLPTLLVKLRGEVAINLRSKTAIDSKSRLVSTFANVPDARAAKFTLQVNGGRRGILTVTRNRRGRINLCNQEQTALVEIDGQNGKRADYPVRVKTPCAKKAKKGARRGR